jgi:GT2 family glycosyltransferase
LVAISILNWNRWRDTLECLESIRQLNYPNYLTIVLDNGSQNDSIERVRAWAKENVGEARVLVEYNRAAALAGGEQNKEEFLDRFGARSRMVLVSVGENLGFTGGNNVGIRYALHRPRPADYVFLLNNDAAVDPDCLWILVQADAAANAGIVGAVVKEKSSGRVQFAGYNKTFAVARELFRPVLRPSSKFESRDDISPSAWVNGAAMLIRKDTLWDVYASTGRYLDDRLFLYYEELELCSLARRLGYKSVVAKKALVYHNEAESSGGRFNPVAYYYSNRNRLLLANELLPIPGKVLFHFVHLPVCLGRVLKNLAHKRPRSARAILCSLSDGYRGTTGKWRYHDREVAKSAVK